MRAGVCLFRWHLRGTRHGRNVGGAGLYCQHGPCPAALPAAFTMKTLGEGRVPETSLLMAPSRRAGIAHCRLPSFRLTAPPQAGHVKTLQCPWLRLVCALLQAEQTLLSLAVIFRITGSLPDLAESKARRSGISALCALPSARGLSRTVMCLAPSPASAPTREHPPAPPRPAQPCRVSLPAAPCFATQTQPGRTATRPRRPRMYRKPLRG